MEIAESSALDLCYPDGVPEGFPVDLFAPLQGDSMVFRERAVQQKLDALQAELGQLPQEDLPVRNVFAGGCYARELFIPKGTILIGKLHLSEHLNICSQGDLTFLTPDGPKRVRAPAMFAAPPGTKKMAYANEDTIWINVHPAIHEDPEMIVSALTLDTYAEYDRALSYNSLLQEVGHFGFTAEQMHEISVNPETLDETPMEGVEVKSSPIHGFGLFATQAFAAGDTICPATIGDKRSLAGRYSNHHHTPNCEFVVRGPEMVLAAVADIAPGDELTTNYGATLHIVLGARSES
jgi:hypothetical protein